MPFASTTEERNCRANAIRPYTLFLAQCPMPNAQCPMPNAQCPMPHVHFQTFPIIRYRAWVAIT
ncbi:MAG: hypothetical protein F6J93_20620 [Oscillatoria sp. SIO1A7]|nr:hypothetical protein [Oscillatoria sp. SIO1A7]